MSGSMIGIDNDTSAIERNKCGKLRNDTSIDDLPDGVLAEILSRLPCNKFVYRCTSVSKHWYTLVSVLISDPYFIGQFVRLQSDRKIPIIRTLLNDEAEELLTTKQDEEQSSLPSKPLTRLFKKLMSSHSLESEPVVVATCNDLVLCLVLGCASEDYQSDYFICNPYTIQWVPLPPPPRVYEDYVAVGFICDVDNAQHSCRCKVVRIPDEINQEVSFNMKVEIFSSETGKWRESIVSFTQEIECCDLDISYPYNGMLYWESENDDRNCFIGFDPFMINTSSSDGIDHYKGRIIDFGDAPNSIRIDNNIVCVGVYGRCLRFSSNLFNLFSSTSHVWELEEEQDERAVDRSGKLILKCTTYSLDRQMSHGIDPMLYLRQFFDPNDEDILYICDEVAGKFKCNIRTREWSKMPSHMLNQHGFFSFQLQLITLPWWPTPVPRLPEDQPPHGAA